MSCAITFLGTGGSSGVPQIGCTCSVCMSDHYKNKRTRTSVCIHYNGANIVIDTSPEFRLQALSNSLERLDAIVYTHAHADHIMGLADIRGFNFMQNGPVDLYADEATLERIKESFSYIFDAPEELKKYYPQIESHVVDGPFTLFGLEMIPFTVYHYKMPVTAFRFMNCAYVTDLSEIPEENYAYLEGLDLLILEAFRYESHISHLSLSEAVDIALRVGAKRTLFTHISHKLDHDRVTFSLPDSMELAYDGLRIPLDGS